MQKRIDAMQGHFIVCGAGQTGTSVIRELTSTNRVCVAIEHNQQHVAELERSFPEVAVLHGDSSDDEMLTKAGVQRAAGIVVCTDDDKNALVTTVLARQLNPNVRVVARATSDKAASRLRQAGADGVVSPAQIGGMRLASELIRPSVVTFLDQMLRDTNRNLRIEDIPVTPGSRGAETARVRHWAAAARRAHARGRVPVQSARDHARAAGESSDRDGRSRLGTAPSRRRGAGERERLVRAARRAFDLIQAAHHEACRTARELATSRRTARRSSAPNPARRAGQKSRPRGRS